MDDDGKGSSEREVALYGRPTAGELVHAVRGFLADDVFEATEGRVQFHVRVAVRVLDTVARQLQLEASHLAAHEAFLAELGFADDRALVEAIRVGAFDGRIGELAAALEPEVRARLEVANPGYIDS